MSQSKSKANLSLLDPLESGRELVRSVGKPSTKWLAEEANKSGQTLLEQLLGVSFDSKNHDNNTPHNEGESVKNGTHGVEIFNFLTHKQTYSEKQQMHVDKAPRPHIEAGIDYHREIVNGREKASKNEMREMNQNIEQIKKELSRLVSSTQVLNLKFAEVSVEQTTKTVGNYHVNFFEWMLAVIRAAREKVEDSNAWLGTIQNKGNQKGYWNMFKKHGTTFGLSGERAVATQVG